MPGQADISAKNWELTAKDATHPTDQAVNFSKELRTLHMIDQAGGSGRSL